MFRSATNRMILWLMSFYFLVEGTLAFSTALRVDGHYILLHGWAPVTGYGIYGALCFTLMVVSIRTASYIRTLDPVVHVKRYDR